MHHAERPSPYLESIWAANFFVTMHTNAKKFPLLGWLQYCSVPPAAIANYVGAIGANSKAFRKRIDDRGKTQHPDHFDQLLAPGAPIPSKKDLESLETICLHLLLAGYEPISSSFHGIMSLSLQDPRSYQRLVDEIRGTFSSYEEITADSLVPLKFLRATIMEQLRIIVVGATGQPRVSPGALIDGHYIPRGVSHDRRSPPPCLTGFYRAANLGMICANFGLQVVVQHGNYAFTRDSRWFHDPFVFRPQRWLPRDDPDWDAAFADDARDDFHPWSVGVRGCPGMSLSWHEIRLIIAKVLWTFDVELLPGQHVSYERDFKLWGMLEKPDLWVRFKPVERRR